MEADLHMHTVASDGTDTLEERINQASEKDLDAIAITDHNSINDDLEGRFKVDEETGLNIITGAEIECRVQGQSIEILSYFLDPASGNLQDLLTEIYEMRCERLEDIIKNLNEEISYELTRKEVFEHVTANPGRIHIAQAMVEAEDLEEVETVQDAFRGYIGSDRPAYISAPKKDAGEVISTVLESGGVPVLAHPGRDLGDGKAKQVIRELTEHGLKGLEVEYSWSKARKKGFGVNFGRERTGRLAEAFDLVKTGGSDCHGSGAQRFLIGSVKAPEDAVEQLADLSDLQQSPF